MLQRVKTILGTKQLIAAYTRTQTLPEPELAIVLPVFGCCILLLLVPKTVLTLYNLCWW